MALQDTGTGYGNSGGYDSGINKNVVPVLYP